MFLGDTNNELSYPWHGFLPVFLCHDSRVRRRGGLIRQVLLIFNIKLPNITSINKASRGTYDKSSS